MKCSGCNVSTCGWDECDHCDEIICTGLCPSCHTKENCTFCKKELDLEKDNPIRNVMYQYFCNMKCYEKREEDLIK